MSPLTFAIRALVLGVLLGCIGCTPRRSDSYIVTVDTEFSPANAELLMAALDDWESKVPVHFQRLVGACSGVHEGAICIHADSAAFIHAKCTDSEAGGCTTYSGGFLGDGGEIWLDESLPADQVQPIAGHELGHAMGLVHQEGIVLMSPEVTATAAMPADVAQWNELRAGNSL